MCKYKSSLTTDLKKRSTYKLYLILLSISLTLLFSLKTYAENNIEKKMFISVLVNENYIQTDTTPYIENERTLLSLRSLSNALQLDLQWIQEEHKIILNYNTTKIELFTQEDYRSKAIVNGIEYEMDVPIEIKNDRTMIPARFVSEHMGFDIEWDGITFTLIINSDDEVLASSFIKDKTYNVEDFMWLSRIVNVETGGSSFANKLAVANVVLNRVKSERFPKSIYDVIFDTKWTVQFPPAFRDGFRDISPSHNSRIAAKMALEGINNIKNCIFFNNVPFTSSDITFYKKLGGNYFYY